jgi:hypothetical protein
MPTTQTAARPVVDLPGIRPTLAREAGQHHVPIEELLTPAFVVRHSRFDSIGAFLDASGIAPQTLTNLDRRTQFHWDQFVRTTTDFCDWEGMLRAARGEWLFKRVGIVTDA